MVVEVMMSILITTIVKRVVKNPMDAMLMSSWPLLTYFW